MLKQIIVGATALSLAFTALIGGADAAPKKPAPRSAPAASATVTSDQAFVTQATYINNGEIELGNMILHQGLSGHLRNFGIKLVHDHTMMKDELKKIAAGAHFTQPGTIDPNMVPTRDKLKKLQGIAFDKAIWPVLISGHQKAVAIFKAEIASGKNKELVLWAKQRLPTIQMHLSMALKEQNGATDSGTGKPSK